MRDNAIREAFVTAVAQAFEPVKDQAGPVRLEGPEPFIRFLEPQGIRELTNVSHWLERYRDADDPDALIRELVQRLLPKPWERRLTARRHLPSVFVRRDARLRLFDEVVGADLIPLGFQRRRDGRYLRPEGEDGWTIVQLAQWTRSGYYACFNWGFSVPCFPSRWARRPEWRRTFASAMIDLLESRPEYVDAYDIDLNHGEAVCAQDMKRNWVDRKPLLSAWLSRHAGFEKLLLAEELDAEVAYHRAKAVRPFLLARLGRSEEARAALQDINRRYFVFGPWPRGTESLDVLQEALEIVIERHG